MNLKTAVQPLMNTDKHGFQGATRRTVLTPGTFTRLTSRICDCSGVGIYVATSPPGPPGTRSGSRAVVVPEGQPGNLDGRIERGAYDARAVVVPEGQPDSSPALERREKPFRVPSVPEGRPSRLASCGAEPQASLSGRGDFRASDPALKRRAILGLSLRDNGLGGSGAGAEASARPTPQWLATIFPAQRSRNQANRSTTDFTDSTDFFYPCHPRNPWSEILRENERLCWIIIWGSFLAVNFNLSE